MNWNWKSFPNLCQEVIVKSATATRFAIRFLAEKSRIKWNWALESRICGLLMPFSGALGFDGFAELGECH